MTALIWVAKDGEEIEVHPDALKEHLKLGWRRLPAVYDQAAYATQPMKRGPGRPKKSSGE